MLKLIIEGRTLNPTQFPFQYQKMHCWREESENISIAFKMSLMEPNPRSEEVRLLLLVRLPGPQLPLGAEHGGRRTEIDEGKVFGRFLLLLFRRVRKVEGGEAGPICIFRCSGKRFNREVTS